MLHGGQQRPTACDYDPMLLTKSKFVVGVVGAVLGVVVMGSPALAGDVSSAGFLMTAEDFRGQYGSVRDSFTNDLGRVLPSSCSSPSTGSTPSGRETVSAPYREVEFSDGLTVQNTVYVYRSPAAARASFALLEARTLATCQGEFYTPFGDDEAVVPQVVAAGARRLSPVGTHPTFSYGQSLILLEPASAPPGYADLFSYGVFSLVDNAIVQVSAFSDAPLAPTVRSDVRRVSEAVSTRFAAAAG